MKNIIAICFLFCFSPFLYGSQDSLVTIGEIKSDSMNSKNIIIIKSRFWGKYECNGNKLTFGGVKQKYIELGDKKLLNHRRNSLLLEWLGPLPFYVAAFVLVNQRAPAYVSFPVLCLGLIPGYIGQYNYNNTIDEYNLLIQNKTKATEINIEMPISIRYSMEF
jgi:hypothetical protein